ncbi:Zinc finger RING/FYVE/PHD-type protein [Dioscorea alata]|uniref:Zinc finger RING/FYVE/PHD-type protein n=1 Tax=Dioscorea alata TaxID=55571 RepID=A0ACB7TZM9_DIOAL|nr:Zinc finger RING/FYVE/PHD-type protein [Dioscorea alata]
MAFAFYYPSLPRAYILLLELVGILRFSIFMCSRFLGNYISIPRRHEEETPSRSPASIKESLSVILFGSIAQRRRFHGEEKNSEYLCVICMSCLEPDHEIRELSNCCHGFHLTCMDVWLDEEGHSTCPLCRSSLL